MGSSGDRVWELPGYILLERIALGGRGEVYLAREGDESGPLVAVKVLRPEDANRRDRVQAFLDEVAISSLLIHPNIVRVYHGDIHDGLPYLVMEHVDGLTLWDVNERARMVDQRVPFEVCAYMAAKTAEALQYAHELTDSSGRLLNLVHRDVSAVNVMATFDGAIKLLDFGIARFSNRRQQTAPGIIKGKLDYLSPEQCEGGTIDAVTDIYSLGVLLFELCTGTRPFFETDVAALFKKVARGDRPRVRDLSPGVPPQLEQIVDKAMATKRKHRFPSAGRMLHDLEAFLRACPSRPTSTTVAQLMFELAPDKVRQVAETYGPPETTAVSKAPDLSASHYQQDEGLLEAPTIAQFGAAASLSGFSEDDDEATQIDSPAARFGRNPSLGADTVVEESPMAFAEAPPKNWTALVVLAILALFSLATLAGIVVTLAVRSRASAELPQEGDPTNLITGDAATKLGANNALIDQDDPGLPTKMGRVVLWISPPGALISLAGQRHLATESELTLDVPPGTHQLRVQAEGLGEKLRDVVVRAGQRTDVSLSLSSHVGFLTVTTRRRAMVLINSRKIHLSPVERLELDPGTYDVRIASRWGARSREVQVKAGQEEQVYFDFK